MGACSISKKEIILGGLNCAHCAEIINDKVSKLEEIESCNLNLIADLSTYKRDIKDRR